MSFSSEVKEELSRHLGKSRHCQIADRGTKRIAQKVGEEGVETALAATVHDREELRNEAADLVYHLLVLLADADLELADVIDVLRARHASREKAAEAK